LGLGNSRKRGSGTNMANIALDATDIVDLLPRGTATYSRQLLESLAKVECSHHFRIYYPLARLSQRHRFLKPLVRPGPASPRFTRGVYSRPFTFWLPWQADVVHALSQQPPPFRYKKEIVTIHDVIPLVDGDYYEPPIKERFARLLRESAERAVRIITPSHYTADRLVEMLGTPREKLRVIAEGVDPPRHVMNDAERKEERERLVGKGSEMILSVGVLENRKNVLNVLRAMQLLPARYQLVLAGGNGYGAETIHGFIRRERLESRVTLLGHVAPGSLSEVYQAASVFLFPSLEEGFGLAVLEAMANGTPVVSSAISSLPEVAAQGAVYAEARDPRDLAEKTQQLVEDLNLREKMIAAGLARAKQFSWPRMARETVEVYEEVLRL
jgi:glycosyltransferase involved in cell wall biosynthesis